MGIYWRNMIRVQKKKSSFLLMKNICDVLDIDYEEIKDKFPDPDEADNDLSRAQNILDGVKADDEGTKGGTPEPTE